MGHYKMSLCGGINYKKVMASKEIPAELIKAGGWNNLRGDS